MNGDRLERPIPAARSYFVATYSSGTSPSKTSINASEIALPFWRFLHRYNRGRQQPDRLLGVQYPIGQSHCAIQSLWFRLAISVSLRKFSAFVFNFRRCVEYCVRANRSSRERFLRKAFAQHGRPDRIIIDGNQTIHEAIVSCDLEDRLRDRSRR